MYRTAITELQAWKNAPARLPLIVRGARQVGKTWLIEEFGKTSFNSYVKINFERNSAAKQIFDGDIDPKRIIRLLEIISQKKISPHDTLVFLDEIQEAPRALTALKYFAEDAPEFPVIAAGSLLGIAEHEGISFPVGKVSFMNLYPMSFKEFLLAAGEKGLAELLSEDFSMVNTFHDSYIEHLREYMLTGGMPAAVSSWPSQLAKENKKFTYSIIKEGAKSKDYETSFAWLESCRIINRVHRVTVPAIPMSAYEDQSVFKLFMHDTGLLCALSRIDPRIMLEGNSVMDMFKGSLTEQYVLQELISSGWTGIAYYSNERSTAEIDFLIESGGDIIPLEVKSGINTKAKSLKTYREKYKPCVSFRASLLPYKEQDGLINVPLYAASRIKDLIQHV